MRLLEPLEPPLPQLSALDPAAPAPRALEIGTDTPLEAITPHLEALELIAIRFPGFRDGRGFSLAATLRGRGFQGELRATGYLLPDQAILLARSGFDAAERPREEAEAWSQALLAFSASYQPAADGAPHVWALRARARTAASPPQNPEDQARALNERLRDASAEAVLRAAVTHEFVGQVAVLSSFGAEAAVTLHMLAAIAPDTPVLFLETERHFAQTLQYRDELAARLKLTDVRTISPVGAPEADPKGDLWRHDPDACCALRKVKPLAGAAASFGALVTGRKRMHGGERLRLPMFEAVDGQIKVNPLAAWTGADIAAYYERHELPRHPLVEQGFASIGCWPCTRAVEGPETRAGRWAGSEKTECGIHLPSRWAADPVRKRAS